MESVEGFSSLKSSKMMVKNNSKSLDQPLAPENRFVSIERINSVRTIVKKSVAVYIIGDDMISRSQQYVLSRFMAVVFLKLLVAASLSGCGGSAEPTPLEQVMLNHLMALRTSGFNQQGGMTNYGTVSSLQFVHAEMKLMTDDEKADFKVHWNDVYSEFNQSVDWELFENKERLEEFESGLEEQRNAMREQWRERGGAEPFSDRPRP